MRNPLRSISPRARQAVLLSLSTALLVTGLCLPVLTVEKLIFFDNTFSIASGIAALAREGNLPLAVMLFAFSVAFPIAKLSALWLVWYGSVTGHRRERLLAWLHRLGRWSMLDVFVVALTVVSVKLGALATAQPRVGLWVFAAAALLTMVATEHAEAITSQSPRAIPATPTP